MFYLRRHRTEMARDNKNLKGLDDLNKLLDSLQDKKFRARALRNAGKQALEPVKQAMQEAVPDVLKEHVQVKIKVNTNKTPKVGKGGYIKDDQYNELYGRVTFSTKKGLFGKESPYGMAVILNYGRRNPLARIGKDTKFHAFGKETQEIFRNIGTTEPLSFSEKVQFETEDTLAKNFGDVLLKEVQNEIRKQDKRNKKK